MSTRDQVLVDADWVEGHLDDPKIVLVEVDEDTAAYDKSHIKGAVRLDWKKDLQDPVRRDFVSKEQFEALLSERGIGNDDTVVLYGGNNNWFAAYAYWYFKLYGHDDVKLLDGGRKKWELDSPRAGRRGRAAARDDVHGEGPGPLDPRLPRRGRGGHRRSRTSSTSDRPTSSPAGWPRPRTSRRSRRSATATSRPPRTSRGRKTANDDGTFKSDDELKKLYDDKGVDFSKDTIAYCRIGERSSHTWFVLHEILEQPNVKNYDGSWTEWGSLVGVPIELGDGA